MTRIIIVDDHELLRQGLVSLISANRNYTILAELSSKEEAINFVSTYKPQTEDTLIAIVDLSFKVTDNDIWGGGSVQTSWI